jgi:succinyl-CoA synthetase beta subunit
MQLLEHVGKELLEAEGVRTPRGKVASTVEQAVAIANELGGAVAVKAQIPASGRGKAGGVVIVDHTDVAVETQRLLGSDILGHPVGAVLVEEALPAGRELYLAITVDPQSRRPVVLLGREGGVEVEAGADSIARVEWSLGAGLRPHHVWRASEVAGVPPETARRLVGVARSMASLFTRGRYQLVEVNPLVVVGDHLVAADCRVIPDPAVSPAARTESQELGFDYLTLDPHGDIGLITTGAGASMLLVDLLTTAGLRPINFCDMRTGSFHGDPTRLIHVIGALTRHRSLTAIAVNVFAGITDLADVAELMELTLEGHRPDVPIIARVEGRGARAARVVLRRAGVETVTSFEELVERCSIVVRKEVGAS